MKIYYNSKIAKLFTFIDGYKTIMLFGAVFTERDAISLKAEYHEGTHCNQYQALFATGFIIISIIALVSGLNGHAGWWMLWLLTIPVFLYYVWYLVEYLIRLCIYRNHKKAYRYDGMRDLINNADEDVDCITSATEKSSMYRNDSFFVFV